MTIYNNLSGHTLLLSGHPGSGKSTIADALAHLPGVPKVHFHSDDLWGYIKHGRIDPWLPQSHQQNRMIMQIAADVAGRYAKRATSSSLTASCDQTGFRPLRHLPGHSTTSSCAPQRQRQSNAVWPGVATASATLMSWPIFIRNLPISAPLSTTSYKCLARTRIRLCSRSSMRCNRHVSVSILWMKVIDNERAG